MHLTTGVGPMSALTKSRRDSEALVNSAHDRAVQSKSVGGLAGQMGGSPSMLGGFRDQGRYRQQYSLYRGWLYSAINAIATAAAGQPVQLGKLLDAPPTEEEERKRLGKVKEYHLPRMTKTIESKAVHGDLEILEGHPLLDVLNRPNMIQDRWQFVYSFVANLLLTGWGYIVAHEEDGRMELYSLPTTWIRPNKDFSEFKIVNPKRPEASQNAESLTRNDVAFAYLPNPSDPMSALAPTASQILSIRIDDHIQTSQETFFNQGVFPSVVVTVGKEPRDGMPGGARPRLTGRQRNQIHAVIRRLMAGVHNYGNPAIVDGLIESITRLSATTNEMGWEKSGEVVRDRILSAYGVNPYILGAKVPGSYAASYTTNKIFYDRVNTYLDLLGNVLSNFLGGPQSEERLEIWYEKLVPTDPALEQKLWMEARKNNDVTRNEMRARLGLPPSEEDVADRSKMLETVGGMVATITLMKEVGMGTIGTEEAANMLSEFLELPLERVQAIIGDGKQKPEEVVETLRAVALSLRPQEVAGLLIDETKKECGCYGA